MTTASSRELTALRLGAQAIASSAFRTPREVVSWMLAMQAQDFGGAKWAIGLRLPGSTDATIEAALAAGELVRSWPMRGTLHFTTPEDLGWILDVTVPRQANQAARRRQELEITDQQLDRAGEIALEVMSDGSAIRRDQMIEVWEAAGIPAGGQRAYHLLWNLGQRKRIVFGPVDGKHPTFMRFDATVHDPRRLEPDEALGEFATRYFRSHGPATVRDFAWWSSLTLGDARKGVALATGLEERDFGGVAHYLAEGLEPVAPRAVHALPGFDEYLLGYQDRSPALSDEFRDRIVPGNNGVFLPTIVVDGQVRGTWKRTETAKTVRIETEEFTELTARARAGFERAAQRYGAFLGKAVEFTR